MKKTYFLLLAIFLFSCSKDDSIIPEPSPTEDTVKYTVTTTAKGFDLTYINSTGNTEQLTLKENTNWEYSYIAPANTFVYVNAQSKSEDATISIKIYYQEKIIEQATSTGDFVVAIASGKTP